MSEAYNRLGLLVESYVAVTNSYFDQIEGLAAPEAQRDPLLQAALQSLDQALDAEPGPSLTLEPLDESEAAGQNIAATKSTLQALDLYCKEILERLDHSQWLPGRVQQYTRLLTGSREDLILRFGSLTLTMDRLVDLSRIAVLPNRSELSKRDLLSRMVVEFELLMRRLLVVARMDNPGKLAVGSDISLERLLQVESKHGSFEMLNMIIGASLPDDALEQLQELEDVCARLLAQNSASPQACDDFWEVLQDRKKELLVLLQRREIRFHPLSSEGEVPGPEALRRASNLLAIYGVGLAAIVWLYSTPSEEQPKQVFQRLVYVTRNFLDEGRWERAKGVALIGERLRRPYNLYKGYPEDDGVPMFKCNGWWAASKLGEDITGDVRAWPTGHLHTRYRFLQKVLLGQHEIAAELLVQLLAPEETGIPNMHVEEVRKWPILEDFRKSKAFADRFGAPGVPV